MFGTDRDGYRHSVTFHDELNRERNAPFIEFEAERCSLDSLGAVTDER